MAVTTTEPSGSEMQPQDLTEITFRRIHGVLSQQDSMEQEPLEAALKHRASILKSFTNPFPPPSKESRKAVESGTVKLSDGTVLEVADEDKEDIWEISAALDLDETEALVLFRLFLFDQPFPIEHASNKAFLLDAVTDFYFDQRLEAIRTIAALLRIRYSTHDPYHALAVELLSAWFSEQGKFPQNVLKSMADMASKTLPSSATKTARSTAKWAKQSLKEQLAALEVIFWTSVASGADGAFLNQFLATTRDMDLGRNQKYVNVLLDEESANLFGDIEVLWNITGVQLLKLDKLLDEGLDLELATKQRHGYLASPDDVRNATDAVNALPDDARYSPIIGAWGYVLSRISQIPADEVPQPYEAFYNALNPSQGRRSRIQPEPPSLGIADATINRAIVLGYLPTLQSYLNTSLFSTSIHASLQSSISEPNNGQFRYIMKGLLSSLLTSVQVEYIAQYDVLVDVWAGVFGQGEMPIVAGLCFDFWTRDTETNVQQRSLLDLSRSRFPVEISPLLKLLRGMSGSGGIPELDSLATDGPSASYRVSAARHVYAYFADLRTYTQVIPPKYLSGPQPLFDTKPDPVYGYYYTNTRVVQLPGGSELPAASIGRVVSNQGTIVVSWIHQHSGWRLLLDILRAYHRQRVLQGRGHGPSRDFGKAASHVALDLEDVGIQVDEEEALIADILDLFRCLLFNNLELADQAANDLRSDAPYSASLLNDSSASPDLIQVTLLILKDALVSSTQSRSVPPTRIVASALGVLAALLPVVPGQVWPFLRSLPQLFGDERHRGSTPVLLNVEQVIGTYGMTLALLDLVGALFDEAFRMVLTHGKTLQQMKIDVLLRALSFVHSEIWIDHTNWKYQRVSDRFEIGRKIANIYGEVLKLSPPMPDVISPSETVDETLVPLTRLVLETFYTKATSSTINPLIVTIATSRDVFQTLHRAGRHMDGSRLTPLLEANLRLSRLVLVRKQAFGATKLCLLEQMMFSGLPGSSNSYSSRPSRLEPVDVIANIVKDHYFGQSITIEAIQFLSALCASTSLITPVAPSLVSHIANPENVAATYIRMLEDSFEDIEVRKAMWDFVSIVVDTQPAFSGLFISGHLQTSMDMEDKKDGGKKPEKESVKTALSVASDLVSVPILWDVSPILLSCALGVLDLAWQHALRHLDALAKTRADTEFWLHLASIATKALGDPPESTVETLIETQSGEVRAEQDEAVSFYAHRATSKAHALHILALDMKISSPKDRLAKSLPQSATTAIGLFKSQKDFICHIDEAAKCSYSPSLHVELQTSINAHFPEFTLNSVRVSSLPSQRTYGDRYLYQSEVVHNRLMKYAASNTELADQATEIFKRTCSVNLDWSLTDSQTVLMRSWKRLLEETAGWLKSTKELENVTLLAASKLAAVVAEERRSGDVMRAVHSERLALLQSVVEVTWLVGGQNATAEQHTLPLLRNVRHITLSETFPPLLSVRRLVSPPFHRTLLRIIYFCAHKSAALCSSSSTKLDIRLKIGSDINEILGFVIDGIRALLDLIGPDSESDGVDLDMRLLVAVFERCTKPELHTTPSTWLARCRDVDLTRSSLEVLVRTSLSGYDGGGDPRPKSRQFSHDILFMNLIMARQATSGERLAQEGVLAAYAKTDLTAYLEAGAVDASRAGEYNPAHRAWCTMLGVTTALVNVLRSEGHFLSNDIVGFIQLCGAQLTRVLGWTIETPLTLPFLEEMQRTMELFQAIASASTYGPEIMDAGVVEILRAFLERGLNLLQQLNYALSHPNHLATLLEGITPEERAQMDKEIGGTTIDSVVQVLDPINRPLLSSVVQRLLIVIRDIVSSLTIVCKADALFSTRDVQQAIQAPPLIPVDSKVLASGPASIGTLREISAFSLDVVRHLNKPENGRSKADSASIPWILRPFDPEVIKTAALQVLEQSLLCAYTQLLAAVHQPIGNVVAAELLDASTSMDIDGRSVFGRSAAAPAGEQIRMTRQFKELAVELNLLAKDVPQKLAPGTKEYFDAIQNATFGLIQSLDTRIRG